ncbi:homeobox protein YOX1/YHP1 [Rhodotorula toruloides]|uniref:Homeobox protein YOX1/YHP1 n=1 Tax=Rhodotorula toruloides TaxID=5286 RepID=A0A511KMR4_RHOTO|nr:homeobox protein YOX1/YHP1 [Rhodotorula toruloides]
MEHTTHSYHYTCPQAQQTHAHANFPSSASTRALASTQSPSPPLVRQADPLALPFSSSPAPPGTRDNPLIPKRRRRTTPAELASLEYSFALNPRPDPIERANIAEQLGMTARAVQVWYQNRRQKEKKDSTPSSTFSSASSIASSGSDPRDLDGVALAFSSSPGDSPALPVYPTTAPVAVPQALKALGPSRELYSSAPASASMIGANKENAGVYVSSRWSAAAQSSSGRLSAAAFLAAKSEPAAPPAAPAPAPIPSFKYSYPSDPSLASAHPVPTSSSAASSASDPYNVPSVYLHRPHNASIIAAKKHVRRRPLGSHAPLARTPSLKNTFEWPPSPPKALGGRPRLSEVTERSGRKSEKEDVGVKRLFADVKGETVALRANAQRKRSTTPTSSSLSVPTTSATLDSAASKPLMTPVSKARVKDELLRHMESDPPTASSPAGPPASGSTRQRDDKDVEEDDEEDQLTSENEEEEVGMRAAAATRPLPARSTSASVAFSASSTGKTGSTFQRAQSLGRTVSLGSASARTFGASSTSTSATLESLATSGSHDTASASSRAGAGLACAIEALGRKRARILENQASIPPPSLVPPTTTAPAPIRHSAVLGQRKSAKNNVFVSQAKSLRLLSGGRKGAAGLSLDLSADTISSSASTRAPQRKKRRVSSESVSTAMTVEEDDLAELSFSSTSTASTVDSLATISDESQSTSDVMSYFALPVPAAMKGATAGLEDKALEDEQRECAELLLGLGGFC